MWKAVIQTDNDSTRLVIRVMLGVVIFAHGAQKLFGWFGGNGFGATMEHFTQGMGIPALFAFLAIIAESLGALALIAGFLTRIAALAIGVVMLVAIMMVHGQYGFFMNWQGQQAGEGFEYHLLAIGLAVPLVMRGAGLWSVDRVWEKALYARAQPSVGDRTNRRTSARHAVRIANLQNRAGVSINTVALAR